LRRSVAFKLAGLAVAAAALAAILLMTEQGAGVLAGAKCMSVWLTSDSQSYGACYDFEREQILEQRRHTLED
jgi:hypothetical protein